MKVLPLPLTLALTSTPIPQTAKEPGSLAPDSLAPGPGQELSEEQPEGAPAGSGPEQELVELPRQASRPPPPHRAPCGLPASPWAWGCREWGAWAGPSRLTCPDPGPGPGRLSRAEAGDPEEPVAAPRVRYPGLAPRKGRQ